MRLRMCLQQRAFTPSFERGHLVRTTSTRLYSPSLRLTQLLFLISALLTGDAFACHSVWLLPDGRECSACVTQPCLSASPLVCKEDAASLRAVGSRDCHACCTLKACDQSDHSQPSTTNAPNLAICVTEDSDLLAALCEPNHATISVHVGQHQPNAPPKSRSSRGPPVQLS